MWLRPHYHPPPWHCTTLLLAELLPKLLDEKKSAPKKFVEAFEPVEP
jgi:hypothetical protein